MCDSCKFYKDYYEENKNKEKVYYKENRDKILEKCKEKYSTNKEDMLRQIKEYQEKNKERLRERVDCECGGHYTVHNKNVHMKSLRHQKYIMELQHNQ